MNCPINEQTADGICCGRCWYYLDDEKICPRHGDVSEEVARFEATNKCTLENIWRKRVGKPLLGVNNANYISRCKS